MILALLSILLAAPGDGFRELFNGKDLTGWVVEGTQMDKEGKPIWSVEDGTIRCTSKGGGFLRFDQEFADFTVRVEYRFSPNSRGNSGIGIRTGKYDPKQSALTRPSWGAYEIQLLDDAGKPANAHSSGSLYRYAAPTANPTKPAPEWNTIEVTCQGPRIAVVLNGEKILDVDQTEVPDHKGKPKGAAAPKDKATRGYINLQCHSGGPVEFRKVQVKELGTSSPSR